MRREDEPLDKKKREYSSKKKKTLARAEVLTELQRGQRLGLKQSRTITLKGFKAAAAASLLRPQHLTVHR